MWPLVRLISENSCRKKLFFLQTTGIIGVAVFLVKFICPRNLFAATKNNNHDSMFLLCHVRFSE